MHCGSFSFERVQDPPTVNCLQDFLSSPLPLGCILQDTRVGRVGLGKGGLCQGLKERKESSDWATHRRNKKCNKVTGKPRWTQDFRLALTLSALNSDPALLGVIEDI